MPERSRATRSLDSWRTFVLGTDGFNMAETREPLRRHFEVDAEQNVVGTLSQLAKQGAIGVDQVAK